MSEPRFPELSRLVKKTELAEIFGVTPRHIENLTRHCGLPVVRLGRVVRYDLSAVAMWLREGHTDQHQQKACKRKGDKRSRRGRPTNLDRRVDRAGMVSRTEEAK